MFCLQIFLQYESNFCRAYKRFRDVMDLYDAIAEAHGSGKNETLYRDVLLAMKSIMLSQLSYLPNCPSLLCQPHPVFLPRSVTITLHVLYAPR